MPDTPDSTPDDAPVLGGALRAMALVASLRTAAVVREAIADRLAGRDPSEQEAARTARADLARLTRDLADDVKRLRVRLATLATDDDLDARAALVQAFEDRLLMNRLGRELHVVHQKLLSLYAPSPEAGVPEATVELARRVQANAARLASDDAAAFARDLGPFTAALADLLDGLADAIAPVA
ncbi:MAG: hypothetical protein AAGF99_03640 [Bacteroidota bacterium]